jgi:serine/threonine protein kinase
MPNGGINLFDVLNDKQTNMTCKLINKLYIKNIDKYLKYLLEGIKLMHSNNIVNRDIKAENITLLLEKEKIKTHNKSIHSIKNKKRAQTIKYKSHIEHKIRIRFIDFSVSEYLNSDFKSDISNIRLRGTYDYIGPEIFIIHHIYIYDIKEKSDVMEEIYNYIYVPYKTTYTKINKFNLHNYEHSIHKLYDKIEKYFNNGTILEKYFGTNKYDGYLQKSDIYGLGINIYKSLYF